LKKVPWENLCIICTKSLFSVRNKLILAGSFQYRPKMFRLLEQPIWFQSIKLKTIILGFRSSGDELHLLSFYLAPSFNLEGFTPVLFLGASEERCQMRSPLHIFGKKKLNEINFLKFLFDFLNLLRVSLR